MRTFEFGPENAGIILIQPADEASRAEIEKEAGLLREMTGEDFRLIAAEVRDWNRDLSPWKAPAVFGKEDFGGEASGTLAEIAVLARQYDRTCILGGFSLAGLFSLWAACETDVFAGVAAASPSVWFPGWTDYRKSRPIRCGTVYLSLGDREEKTRNPVMATVGRCIQKEYRLLQESGIDCALEWNPGNHFQEPELRTAKAFAWVMNQLRKRN